MNNKSSWGGDWTEKKLNAFEKYVNAYLTIMNAYRDKYNWKLIYFDGFAGSGNRKNEEKTEFYTQLFPDDDFRENPYRGAAERVLEIKQRGFDFYYFIDLKSESNDKLKEKLKRFENGKYRLEFRSTDANKQIELLANALKKESKYKAMVLLDPFGMQIDWTSIEKLKDTSCDLWILIPSGVIVNRLLDRKGELMHINKLTDFFGMTEEDIRKSFYTTMHQQTLFGYKEEIVSKISNPINKISEIYIEKLHTIFKYVSDKPLVMDNSNNVPIYHFAFASNNKTAMTIAKEIVGGM